MRRSIPVIAVIVMCLSLAAPSAPATAATSTPAADIFAAVRIQDGNGAGDCAALQADQEQPGQPYTTIQCAAVPSDTIELGFVDFVRTTGGGWPWAGSIGLALDQRYLNDEVLELLDSNGNGCMTVDSETQVRVEWDPCHDGFQQLWVLNAKGEQFIDVGATTAGFGIAVFLCGVPRGKKLIVGAEASCNPYRWQWKIVL